VIPRDDGTPVFQDTYETAVVNLLLDDILREMRQPDASQRIHSSIEILSTTACSPPARNWE
jgi:hypothetical protein